MPLDVLEADFLGDLFSDTHGVWEIFEFVRLHYPGQDDGEVFGIGDKYLSHWIENGWVEVSNRPLYPTQVKTMDAVKAFIHQHGVAAMVYIKGTPSLDITEKGIQALEKEPNRTPEPARFARRSI